MPSARTFPLKSTALFLLLSFAGAAYAVKDEVFERSMKRMAGNMKTLKETQLAPGDKSMHAAESLGGIYEDMIGYWRKDFAKSSENAGKLSMKGKAAAVAMASAIRSGDTAKAQAHLATIRETCNGCHDEYREQLPDGTFRRK